MGDRLKNKQEGRELTKFFRELPFIFIILYTDACLHSSCFSDVLRSMCGHLCWVNVASLSGVCFWKDRRENGLRSSHVKVVKIPIYRYPCIYTHMLHASESCAICESWSQDSWFKVWGCVCGGVRLCCKLDPQTCMGQNNLLLSDAWGNTGLAWIFAHFCVSNLCTTPLATYPWK